ncbi:branched-chain amino acid aminotransferase [Bacillus sp. ISL-47]|uniref:branched-chain amino acid aminotransferase n=1 Tax=Bacillus sp. ISL-47 TaxID=2819130 RepID=UPI001BE8D952|nr:branched-chain amino acid aminotransferase [Bacillus sp. ISL-47]MBT2689546.1 branched-chain amino acid aminotransferase [Bacillus sp. ISL-47]MBT2708365.1 hypothetical protein [Pseudomonas sp. ISL-84]
MLKERIEKHLKEQGNNIYMEEKEFAEKHQLLAEADANDVKNSDNRFADAYIERGDKETEEVLSQETAEFLNQPIEYFQKNKNEFMYLESNWFDLIGAEAVSFETDDVFGNYEVMLGLKLPKKSESAIKSFINENTSSGSAKYSLMFSQQDGLWDFNFSLNDIEGFKEDLTINEAYQLIYRYLFHLVSTVEEKRA